MQEMTHRLTDELRQLAFENHDHCVSCGYKFKQADTSNLGYDADDNPLYVCDSCSTKLKEIAVRHYFSPHPYTIPNSDSLLWRYMDFTKYVSMLSTSSLYFARADTLGDHFEGAKGVKNNKNKWDEHYLSFFKDMLRNPPEGTVWDTSDEHINNESARLLKELDATGEAGRKGVFISCWHENEHESEAMWRLYSSFLDNALAIRTTYASLYEALGKNPSMPIGRVEYIDFSKNYAGPNDSFWRKRTSFSHENEVRVIAHDYRCAELGKSIDCDLSILIEEVFISPSAPSWFIDLVKNINDKYSLRVKVSQSKLNDEPFY